MEIGGGRAGARYRRMSPAPGPAIGTGTQAGAWADGKVPVTPSPELKGLQPSIVKASHDSYGS